MQINIPINMLANGSYVPSSGGTGVAVVTVRQVKGQNKTAIINFAGCNKAAVNFNSDNQPINYTMFDVNAPLTDQQTVSHVVNHLLANGLV